MTPAVQTSVEQGLGVALGRFAITDNHGQERLILEALFGGLNLRFLFDPISHLAFLVRTQDDYDLAVREFNNTGAAYIDNPYDYPFISTIEYVATDACNLACGYCYLGTLPETVTTADRRPVGAIRTIEQLFASDRIGPELKVLLIGGEPLAARQGLAAVLARLKDLSAENGVTLNVNLTTNGTLITDKVAAWLVEEDVHVTLSFDGPFQDANRPFKRASRAVRAVDDLLRVLKLNRVSVRTTLWPEQYESQAAVFCELHKLGIDEIAIDGTYGKQSKQEDAIAMVRGIVALHDECSTRGVYERHLAAAFDSARHGSLARSHCGAGHSHIVLNSRGEVTPCANFDLSKTSDPLRYDVDIDPVCGGCAVRYLCAVTGGGCRAWRGLNGRSEPDPVECAASATRILLALRRLATESNADAQWVSV